jgi:hypothetical protein
MPVTLPKSSKGRHVRKPDVYNIEGESVTFEQMGARLGVPKSTAFQIHKGLRSDPECKRITWELMRYKAGR